MLGSRKYKLKANNCWKAIFLVCLSMAIALGWYFHFKDTVSYPEREESVTSPIMTSSVEISRGDTSRQQVIFTFDCGSGDVSVSKILAVLAKHKVKGTFFMTGRFIEQYPDSVKRIAIAGNEIFNHTYDHPYLTKMSDEEIADELNKADMILKSAVGVSSKPFFRPPYGDRDERVRKVAAENGYEDVYWSIDAHDWMTDATEEVVKERILSNIAPGNIYLMHVGDTITGSILDEVFTSIELRGYKIVSLTQGL